MIFIIIPIYFRQYFGYGLMGLFTLIPVLNIVGICCGCLCGDGDAIPTKRGCGSSCGGCLMMMSETFDLATFCSQVLNDQLQIDMSGVSV